MDTKNKNLLCRKLNLKRRAVNNITDDQLVRTNVDAIVVVEEGQKNIIPFNKPTTYHDTIKAAINSIGIEIIDDDEKQQHQKEELYTGDNTTDDEYDDDAEEDTFTNTAVKETTIQQGVATGGIEATTIAAGNNSIDDVKKKLKNITNP
ncbi:MAG: hypothetical protein [Cotesia congregata filamentous virus 2]